jgi:hypothetical protein
MKIQFQGLVVITVSPTPARAVIFVIFIVVVIITIPPTRFGRPTVSTTAGGLLFRFARHHDHGDDDTYQYDKQDGHDDADDTEYRT